MIFGLVFIAAFTGLFVWQTATALRTGVLPNLGWSVKRTDTPILFWLMVSGSALCIVVGSLFLLLLTSLVLSPSIR